MVKLLLATVLVSAAYAAQDESVPDFVGKTPPKIDIPGKEWLNTKGQVTLEGLKGRVIWLEFGFINCPGCQKMAPHLVRWDKSYRNQGLSVVYLHPGTLDQLADVKADSDKKGKTFPVGRDPEAKAFAAYGVTAMPYALLIGVDGKVVWQGFCNPSKPEAHEQAIKNQLEKVTDEFKLPPGEDGKKTDAKVGG